MKRKKDNQVPNKVLTLNNDEKKVIKLLKSKKIVVHSRYEKNLYDRFNPQNATKEDDSFHAIAIPCSLCIDFRNKKCIGCPIYEQLSQEEEVCIIAMSAILKINNMKEPDLLTILKYKIYWLDSVDDKVNKQFEIIRLSFDRYVEFREDQL